LFLRELAANQAKPWFEANRDRYEAQIRTPALIIAEAVGAGLAQHDLPLTGDARRSMFRINRDVRFSKDKSPYKTHAGLVWMRPGFKKISPGILYLHIADDGCFLAAGFYGLERPALDAIRGAIRDDGPAFTAAVTAGGKAGLTLDTMDSLTRLPRGFDDVTDPALATAIKARHLLLRRTLTRREVAGPGLVDTLLDATRAAMPFLRFGWDAIDESGPPPDWSRLH
jgi:uncharacterized protein (TIGR02453 family)